MVKLSLDDFSITWIAIDWVTCRSTNAISVGLMYSQATVSFRRMSRASRALCDREQ
jgi:hypothetical protein